MKGSLTIKSIARFRGLKDAADAAPVISGVRQRTDLCLYS